jgi:hypothetical protein
MPLPTYHGVGAFGESLFTESIPKQDLSEEELRELYPEVTERLDI